MGTSRKKKNKNFFSDNDIIFDSVACDCEIGVIPLSKELKKYTFHLYPNGGSISYGYKGGKELINGINGKPVLPDLLAIKDEDVNGVKGFIEKHGFLLPLAPNADNSLESKSIFTLINRLKAALWLMTGLGAKETDYKKIVSLTLYLLLTPQTSFELPNGYGMFSTCNHEVGILWQKVNSTSDLEMQGLDETNGEFRIADTVRPPFTVLDVGHYLYATGDGNRDYTFSNVMEKITYLFMYATDVSPQCRLAIDFLYHFYNDIGEIQALNHRGELTLKADNPSASTPSETVLTETDSSASDWCRNRFDEQLQKALIKLAKHTLKTEIEYNLSGIVPAYDTEAMKPTWRIEYLLSGLYYSLFNMHAKEEGYRLCAKPNCGRYFLIRTDSVKRKYCTTSCANANAQSVHRRSKSTKSTETS